jgi:hypothetical protein
MVVLRSASSRQTVENGETPEGLLVAEGIDNGALTGIRCAELR